MEVDRWIEKLQQCEHLSYNEVLQLCNGVKQILIEEPNVLNIPLPVTVVGDVHGQFYDLMELFNIAGFCPNTNYLFLGDYVDRGYFSVETMSLLACLKLRYPNRIYLLRGNHECRQITQIYGFYAECSKKYGNADVWRWFNEVFDCIPCCAIINNNIFAVHGGLSPSISSIDQLRYLDRFIELPLEGPLVDLCWSDPSDHSSGFLVSQRGAGFLFGEDVTKHFLRMNNMQEMLRAHQLCMDGYQISFDGLVSTIWSAPNYCYRCGNKATVLEMNVVGEKDFLFFSAAPASERKFPSAPTAPSGDGKTGNEGEGEVEGEETDLTLPPRYFL